MLILRSNRILRFFGGRLCVRGMAVTSVCCSKVMIFGNSLAFVITRLSAQVAFRVISLYVIKVVDFWLLFTTAAARIGNCFACCLHV